MKKDILVFIILFLLLLLFSWGATVGIVKLITMCFGLEFNLLIATGIWLVLSLLGSFFKSSK